MKPQGTQAPYPAGQATWWSSDLSASDTTSSGPSSQRDSTDSERKQNSSGSWRDPLAGTSVSSRYKILAELGRGGMGIVYRAKDTKLDRLVALKLLPPEWSHDETARRRLVSEAQAASATDHPNICTIHDIDSTDAGQLFIVMAHYDGQTLQARLRGGALETEEILDISIQITDALEAAHAQGVVHRDIKPGNILICRSGMVKVLDFGLASRIKGAPGAEVLDELDIPGSPLGTPNYMAPERILEMPVDPRTDLFSLGVVMYEMATKRRPFAGASLGETVTNVLDNAPLPLTALSPARPLMFERVVNKALAKRAGDRFKSAADLRRALSAIGHRQRPLLRSSVPAGFQSHLAVV